MSILLLLGPSYPSHPGPNPFTEDLYCILFTGAVIIMGIAFVKMVRAKNKSLPYIDSFSIKEVDVFGLEKPNTFQTVFSEEKVLFTPLTEKQWLNQIGYGLLIFVTVLLLGSLIHYYLL